MAEEGSEDQQGCIPVLFDPESILNVYIIDEIAKFLDFKSLISLRLLDKFWSACVTPAFAQKSAILLKYGQRSEDELKSFEIDTKNLNGLSTLKNLKIVWYNRKFYQRKVFAFENEATIFFDILSKLSPTLNSLEIDTRSDDIILSLFPPSNQFHFPALSSLKVIDSDIEEQTRRRLFQILYLSAPNLIKLSVTDVDSDVLSPLLAADGSRNSSLAPSLKSLKMRPYFFGGLSTLTTFHQNWEDLDIQLYTRYWPSDDFEQLAQLLKKTGTLWLD